MVNFILRMFYHNLKKKKKAVLTDSSPNLVGSHTEHPLWKQWPGSLSLNDGSQRAASWRARGLRAHCWPRSAPGQSSTAQRRPCHSGGKRSCQFSIPAQSASPAEAPKAMSSLSGDRSTYSPKKDLN